MSFRIHKTTFAAASAVMNFAAAASDQLDDVITMSEALLGLARAPRSPVELAPLVRRINALLAPAARASGKQLEIAGAFDDLGTTSALPSAVQATIDPRHFDTEQYLGAVRGIIGRLVSSG